MRYVKTFLLAVFILSCSASAFAETITMTTYYPAPSGNYQNMTNNILTVTGNILFSTGGQLFFAGINGGNLYMNAGGAFNAANGMVVRSTGEIGIKMVPAAGRELDVNGDIWATTITAATSASLAAATATTLTTTGIIESGGNLRTNTLAVRSGALLTVANNTQVSGTLAVSGNATMSGSLTVTGNVTAAMFLHPSDERLKEEIVPIASAIDKVKALNGVYFKYKGQEGRKIGLIAQNVETVVPEVVSTDAEGMKMVDYSNLVALLIEAVKEQQVIIEELQGKNDKNK